ncbi:MAG: hypothetical protein M0036_10425 [Desulfobacteraceae bacterium]|nr:hypothetical protein [Desulfobacteraceae bacterium]
MNQSNDAKNETPAPTVKPRWADNAYGKQIVSWVMALVFLFICIYYLQLVGRLSVLTPLRQTHAVSLDEVIAPTLDNDQMVLRGKAPSHSLVGLGSGEKTLAVTQSRSDGGFELSIAPPPFVDAVFLKVYDQQGQPIDTLEVRLDDWAARRPPQITTALFLPELKQLWVAGTGPKFAALQLAFKGLDPPISFRADHYGIFDLLVPLEPKQLPQTLTVCLQGASEPDCATAQEVRRQAPNQPAFGRKAVIISRPFSSLTNNTADPKAVKALDNTLYKLNLEITIDPDHPYFEALAQGYIDEKDFVAGVFGEFQHLLNKQAMDQLREQHEFVSTLLPPSRVFIQDRVGKVQTSLMATGFPAVAFHPRPLWDAGLDGVDENRVGSLATRPLLSAQDQIVFEFGSGEAPKFNPPLPNRLEEGRAVWQGPLTLGKQQILTMPGQTIADLTAGLSLYRAAPFNQAKQEESQRDFMRHLEERAPANLLLHFYRTLLLLAPFLGLLFFIKKDLFDNEDHWSNVCAAALLLGLLSSWQLWMALASRLCRYLIETPVISIWSLVINLRFMQGQIFKEYPYFNVADLSESSLWILWAAMAALIPFYFHHFQHLWSKPMEARPSPARHGFFRRMATITLKSVRFTLFIILLIIYLLLCHQVKWMDQGGVFQELLSQVLDWLNSVLAGSSAHRLSAFDISGILLTGAIIAFFALFGLRSLMFGLGLAASLSYLAWFDAGWAAGWDRWLVVLFMAMAAWPLMAKQLQRLVVFAPDKQWYQRLSALALIAACLLGPRLSYQWVLSGLGMGVLFSLGWLLLRIVGREGQSEVLSPLPRWKQWFLIICFTGAAGVLSWPWRSTEKILSAGQFRAFVTEIDGLFIYIVLAGLLYHLWKRACREPRFVFKPAWQSVGRYLFIFLLINVTVTWAFIPVPFICAWLIATFWLFKKQDEISALENNLSDHTKDMAAQLDALLKGRSNNERLKSIHKALSSKLEKAELSPRQYQHKVVEYDHFFGSQTQSAELPSHALIFSQLAPTEAVAFLQIGALLAAVPLLIAMYQYLPVSQVHFPYPVLSYLVFVILSAAKWILYALFFGFMAVALRGDTGLSKGLHLFAAIAIPFAVYRFLAMHTLQEMHAFGMWIAQVFLFFTLLGILSMEYRLLRKNGLGLDKLKLIHNLPTLSAYGSSLVAAVIPAIVAILSNRISEIVTFFIKMVLPEMPGGLGN